MSVWMVYSKTFSVLFETKEDALRYVSQYPASIGGGMHVIEADVFKCRPQTEDERKG